MSYQEIAKNMIDQVPEDKMLFVINILENLGEMSGMNIHPEFTPNAETLEAIEEVEEMIQTGSGHPFEGSTKDYLNMLLEE